jgi:hypothetical protein
MKTKTYSIFGAGAAGLYTAWRLLNGEAKNKNGANKLLQKGDVLDLYDWGKYDFLNTKQFEGTRAAGARICTWHFQNDKTKSYLELGGMRYAEWDEKLQSGHLLVTTVIKELGLDKNSINFNESSDQLLYLRNRNMYLNEIGAGAPAPYNIPNGGANQSPYQGFAAVQNLSQPSPSTRLEWCKFYQKGKLNKEPGEASVFKNGEPIKNIGYWNLMYDQLGSEGYAYTADANGYSSNVINWNSAVAFNANNEFQPGNQYKTLKDGYSSMFNALFKEIVAMAKAKGIIFNYNPNTRLHSILEKGGQIEYGIATRENPWQKAATKTTDAAWLAMPRHSIDLVAEATRYNKIDGLDVLNNKQVQLYLEAAVMQPSYKVGLFFDTPWWLNATYAPKIICFTVTDEAINQLAKQGWPKSYIDYLKKDKQSKNPKVYNVAFDNEDALVKAVNTCINAILTFPQQSQLFIASKQRNTIGPSFTDTPIRMAVYFGNNALDAKTKPVYGMLASYDDEYFTTFWKELEKGTDQEEDVPEIEDVQTLKGPKLAPKVMIKMLRKQLAEMHFGPGSDYKLVPEPLEARYMDWSLPPFNAGYHAWAAHYDIGDVQRKIRKPAQLIKGKDANIFIVGEAYSNDQAWVEGAYCTAESVLNDFFEMKPIVNNKQYPFICPE